MKIAVAGTGYVGLSIATLLAQKHEVVAVDVIPEKVEKINRKESPIADEYLEKYLTEKPLHLVATLDGRAAYRDAEIVVIAAPTNYDPKKNFFDTSHVDSSSSPLPPTTTPRRTSSTPPTWRRSSTWSWKSIRTR